jgi:hypothetical protein
LATVYFGYSLKIAKIAHFYGLLFPTVKHMQ